jgi:competence protein ComEC
VAHAFASVPNAAVLVELGVAQILIAYLLVVGIALWLARARRLARWAVVLALCIWILGLIPPGTSAPEGLRATFFDVGQGDAALVESPAGARVLIDGGPDPQFLAEALRRRGIRRLDLVALSHFHLDHVNGVPAVLESLDARMLVDPGVPDPLVNRLFRSRPPDASQEGDRFVIGDLVIDVLGPSRELRDLAALPSPDSGSGDEDSSLNNASLVLRVSWDGSCILFTGDLEETAQQALVDDHSPSIRCTILKAPHHGSPRIDQDFVEAVDAEFVVISVGRNDYGHPSRTALSLFEQEGGEILRTDRKGDVVLVIRGGRVEPGG